MHHSTSVSDHSEEPTKGQARPRFQWLKLRKAIEFYESRRLCYLPAGWGRKTPSVAWEAYQSRLPSIEERAEWFHEGNPTNIGVVCGAVSGGLVILCFNDQAGAAEFFGKSYWRKLHRSTFITRSVRGHHVWFYTDTPIRSQFVPKGRNTSWLEIRADGNFTVAPPSLHPSGVLYEAIGVDQIYKHKDLSGFIRERLAELGLRAGEPGLAEGRAKRVDRRRPRRPAGSDELATRRLLEECRFLQSCRDEATTLSEPWWWSMVHILAVFGEPGRAKIRELSAPYPRYTREETDRKIDHALEAVGRHIGPHTCAYIEQTLGFACPDNCQARTLGVKSPAGLAIKLAAGQRHSHYLYCDKNDNLRLDVEKLIGDLLDDFRFITLTDTEEILIFEDGLWQYGGEERIKAEAEDRVGLSNLLTVHVINEIIGHVQRSTYTKRTLLNHATGIVNLRNGLLDIGTRKLMPHTPELLSTTRIPVAYDPNADCPGCKQFLAQVLDPQDVLIIQELAGYALIPDYSIQRAFLFVGDGGNGKSTLLNLFRTFLGNDNCSTVAWHALEHSRFASSRLDGKLLNIYADLPSRSMNSTGTFKMLTGGDAISAEKKFKEGYSFVNSARLVFSANKPPQVLDEDSYAFWRRWIVINFPHQFPEDDPRTDPKILSKLTTDTELSGFLNLALDGLQRLLSNGKFSYAKTVDQTQSYYLRASDPVYAFVEDCCELDPDAVTSKDDVFDAFKSYCQVTKTPVLNPSSFHKELKNSPHWKVTSTRPAVEGERVPSWSGIRLLNPVNPVNSVNPAEMTLCEVREDTDHETVNGMRGVDENLRERG